LAKLVNFALPWSFERRRAVSSSGFKSHLTIERALMLAREGIVTKSEIQLRPPSERINPRWTDQVPLEVGWQANLSELEKALVERAVRQAQGNKSKAAELLGIHRRLLYEKMREFGID
jgi:DNA-binding NtrC family response regulator